MEEEECRRSNRGKGWEGGTEIERRRVDKYEHRRERRRGRLKER